MRRHIADKRIGGRGLIDHLREVPWRNFLPIDRAVFVRLADHPGKAVLPCFRQGTDIVRNPKGNQLIQLVWRFVTSLFNRIRLCQKWIVLPLIVNDQVQLMLNQLVRNGTVFPNPLLNQKIIGINPGEQLLSCRNCLIPLLF